MEGMSADLMRPACARREDDKGAAIIFGQFAPFSDG
jgi:hypothetical protein